MIKDDNEIISALRANLAERVGRDRYEVWFGSITQLVIAGDLLTVGVPNRFFQDWMRAHFRKDLEAVCLATLGRPVSLEFRVDESLAAQLPKKATGRKATHKQTELPLDAEAASSSVATMPAGGASTGPLGSDGSAVLSLTGNLLPANILSRVAEPPAEATSFEPRRRLSTLESFVVGNSNRVAHTSAQLAAAQPGSMSPLLFYGPSGVGKTHLLEGICSAYRRTRRGAVLQLSAEQFTSCFLEALHGSGLPSFRRKVRDVELLLIDDLQFFVGKKATVLELQHTIDAVLRAGRQIVFTADRSPSAMKGLGPELAARLSGGMVCRLEAPEYQTRLGIARQLGMQLQARAGVQMPDEVLAYIASHLTSHARELAGAIKRVHATSLALDKPITLALAEDALAELIHHSGKLVRLDDIERAVCEVFGLESASLQSGCKAKNVSHPRMLAMWLARKHTRAALSEIGRYFGQRSHSTVISAQKKIETWMSQGTALALPDRAWNLEETVRRVEDALRAS